MESPFTLLEYSLLLGLLFYALFSLTTLIQVTRQNRHIAFEKIIHAKNPPLFWRISRAAAKANTFDVLQFFLTGAQQGLRILSILLASFLLFVASQPPVPTFPFLIVGGFAALLTTVFIVFFDFLPRSLAAKHAELAFKFTLTPSSLSLLVFFPFILLALKAAQALSRSRTLQPISTPREQLIQLIDALDEDRVITEADQRLLHSLFNFRERIAREIMRPRVNVFCLPESVSLKEAAIVIQKEGYSRVPVYRETIDSIIGVVFYKDILAAYVSAQEAEEENLLQESIKKHIKPILYCPETKKISSLLQEFRKKQTHLALVVDEYGGTSGLVTIEDILEEIVGDIADEYDDIETFSQRIDDFHWIIDARVNILDLEEETGIKIPQEGEYDTVAGYIFFKLGAIPVAGHVLHHDAYDMKILSCNDRIVDKVEITLHTSSNVQYSDSLE